ncbi:MAG: Phospholipase D-nuclease N-terminal [Akkermansiaceae bacterium]|nr:Phospholipase D-nuclease N-terminal [Akkermansiaceae bacterium]
MNTLSFLNLGGQEIIVIFFVFLPTILFFAALVSCLTANFAESTDKLFWVLVILFAPVIGPLLWFTVGKNKALKV